jgi:hypothetical protein
MEAWPDPPRSADEFERLLKDLDLEYINLGKSWEILGPELQRLLHNLDFSTCLRRLDEAASRLHQQQSVRQNERQKEIWKLKPVRLTTPTLVHSQGTYSLPYLGGDLMRLKHYAGFGSSIEPQAADKRGACNVATIHEVWRDNEFSKALVILPSSLSVLDRIIKRFAASSPTTLRKQYSRDLQTSLMALVQDRSTSSEPKQATCVDNITLEVGLARKTLREQEEKIRGSLSDSTAGFAWLSAGGLWPCLSPVALLEQLRDVNSVQLDPGIKLGLVWYGILITKL